MTGVQGSDEAQQHLDDLRRRLYRDGATAEDRRRYTEQRDLLRAQVPPEPAVEAPRDPARARRRLLLATFAGAVLVVAAIGIATTAQPSRTPEPARSSEAAQDIGDGQTVVQHDPVVGPATIAVDVEGTAAVGQRFEGTGGAVVPLLPADADGGGRVLVALSPTAPAPVAWRALRVSNAGDGSPVARVVRRSAVGGRADTPYPEVFAYRGAAPTRIAVDAQDGVRWTLLVAFTSAEAPTLR